MTRTLGVVVVCALVWAGGAARAQPRAFALDDLARMVRISDPQIAPDGRTIAMVVVRADLDANRWDSQLALVDVNSGAVRQLTRDRRGVGRPRWSPDGRSLAFLARVGEGPDTRTQVFVLPLSGGDPEMITNAPTDIQQFAWSPDGKMFAFAAADERPKKTGRDRFDDAFEVGNDDVLVTESPMPSHAWLISSNGGAARRLTSGTWSLPVSQPPGPPSSPLAWSPDGKTLAIARADTPHDADYFKTTIALVDVATGDIKPLTKASRLETFPSFSPDGSQIAYWFSRDGDINSENDTYVVPASGGAGRSLTRALDRSVSRVEWMPDGQSMLIAANDVQRTSLWVQALDGSSRRIETGRVSINSAFWAEVTVGRTGAIAFVGSDPDHPSELFVMDSLGGTPRRLTDLNREVASLAFGKVEGIDWESDGLQHNGVLTFPRDFDPARKYPLVLVIHGGPQAASLLSFSSQAHLFAAKGWIVFQPNYRGSDQRGNAYFHAIIGDAGGGPGRDVMAGLAAVKKRGFIDDSKIAVTGWSYGGFMTSWLIGHYGGWRVAMAGAPVTDLIDQAYLSDGGWDEFMGGGPYGGNRFEAYRAQSPITYAANIRTPTLVMANTGDFRVPMPQPLKLYRALKDNGVETKFIAYPISGHNAADPIRQRDVQRRWIEWVDQHFNAKPSSQ